MPGGCLGTLQSCRARRVCGTTAILKGVNVARCRPSSLLCEDDVIVRYVGQSCCRRHHGLRGGWGKNGAFITVDEEHGRPTLRHQYSGKRVGLLLLCCLLCCGGKRCGDALREGGRCGPGSTTVPSQRAFYPSRGTKDVRLSVLSYLQQCSWGVCRRTFSIWRPAVLHTASP